MARVEILAVTFAVSLSAGGLCHTLGAKMRDVGREESDTDLMNLDLVAVSQTGSPAASVVVDAEVEVEAEEAASPAMTVDIVGPAQDWVMMVNVQVGSWKLICLSTRLRY